MPSYSSIIRDYLGTDIAANRPVSLNIAPTALGIFYATDTSVLSVWEGAAWHTVVASSGASVSEIVAGAGLSGGTITTAGTVAILADSRFAFNSGTLALANAAASTLFGNSTTASAEPAGTIAIGANLTLSPAGTLSASAPGTGTVTQVDTSGAGISGGPITGTGTITVEWNGGTVTATGTGLVISSDTLAVDTSTIATTAYADAHDNQLMAAAATTGTLPANTYANGTAGVGATLTGNANGALPAQDGVTLNQFDLLLVKDEAAPAHNGLFEYTTVGNAGAPYVLTRWQNFNQTANINAPMIAIPVRGGTVNGNTQWVVSTAVATIGTSAINFTKWGLWQAAQVTSLGTGLTNTAGVLSASGGGGLFSAGIAALGATPTKAGLGLVNFLGTGAAATDTAAGVLVSGSNNGQGAYTTSVPATPYTITAFIGAGRNGSIPALGWTDGTKVQFIYCQAGAGNTIVQSNSNITTFSATNITGVQGQHSSGAFFRISDNGTNVTFSAAPDGINFYTIFSVAKASGFLGSTGYSHIFVGSPTAVGTPQMTIFNWLQT